MHRQYQQQAEEAGQPLFLKTIKTKLFNFVKGPPKFKRDFKVVQAIQGTFFLYFKFMKNEVSQQ